MSDQAITLQPRARLLTLWEAAQTLAISKRTLERLIVGEEFPRPLKIGRSSRVKWTPLVGQEERSIKIFISPDATASVAAMECVTEQQ